MEKEYDWCFNYKNQVIKYWVDKTYYKPKPNGKVSIFIHYFSDEKEWGFINVSENPDTLMPLGPELAKKHFLEMIGEKEELE